MITYLLKGRREEEEEVVVVIVVVTETTTRVMKPILIRYAKHGFVPDLGKIISML